jgi:hypothetical protein
MFGGYMYRRTFVRGIGGLLAVAIVLTFLSCSAQAAGGGGDPEDEDPGDFTEVSELFEPVGTNTTRLRTNEERFWSPSGYTVWTVWDGGESEPFTTRTVTLSKSEGEAMAGYGLILCHANRPGFGLTMLTVMINVKGQYTIGKVIDGSYQALVPWTSSESLRKNYVSNTITVSYDDDASEYTLTINGTMVQTFKDETEPRHTGGKNGYLVVFSPYDTFPSETVDVSFVEDK